MSKEREQLLFKTITIVSVIVIIFFAGFTSTNAYYSLPRTDDFRHAVGVGSFHTSLANYLPACILYAKTMYLTWQGTYFSMFLQALLSPMNHAGLMQLRIVMICNAALFFVSLVFFCVSSYQLFFGQRYYKSALFLVALLLIQLFGFRIYEEVFEWYSGCISYSIPLSLLFLSLGIYCRFLHSHKKKLLFLAIILGFLAMGGSLTISGTGCACLLLLVLWSFQKKEKTTRYHLMVFSFYFLFALINALAPGNFARQSEASDYLSLLGAMTNTFSQYGFELKWLLTDTPIIAILFLSCCCGLCSVPFIQGSYMRYLFISISLLLVPIGTIFPVVLGYNSTAYYPNRCYFVLDVVLLLILFNLSFSIGCLIHHKVSPRINSFLMCTMLCLSVVGLVVVDYTDNVLRKQIYQLKEGIVQNYYAESTHVLELIEFSEEDDVLIFDYDYPEPIECFSPFILTADPTNSTNTAIAIIYGKHSVMVQYAE